MALQAQQLPCGCHFLVKIDRQNRDDPPPCGLPRAQGGEKVQDEGQAGMGNGRYTVVSTMKNEGPYILEWVAHYKALGFDDIVVCTNDCQDTTVQILKHLEELGLVHHHATRIGRGGIHRSALRQAWRKPVVREAEWVFVCDVDEFLNIHVGDGSVRALVETAVHDDDTWAVCVPWRIFGPNGITLFRDRLVTRQFTMAEKPWPENPAAGKFVKSLFRRADRVKRMGLHMPVLHEEDVPKARYVLPGGEDYIVGGAHVAKGPSWAHAQVNHYALRSLESFLIKRDRGRANHMNHTIGFDYWNRFNHNDVEDTSIRRYDDRVADWLERFHADEKLHFLHRKAVRWHRWKARQLRGVPEFKALKFAAMATMGRVRSGSGTAERAA